MKLTADTITDEQIRSLRDMPASTIRKQRGHRLVLVAVALGERRARRGESRAMARARCAELFNARNK